MSYTDGLDDPTIYFNTKLYTGNGSTNAISSVGFAPDWTLLKDRNDTSGTRVYDTVRGAVKRIRTDITDAEINDSDGLTAFGTDGFTLGADGATNASSTLYVSWNWSAGGASPAITYTVKVVSDSGNKYRFDDFGTSAVTLDLQEGGTYTFDQSDSSNSGHPLRFSTTSNGTHGGGSEYTTGVTTTGTPGSAGAKTVITVAASAPTLYYYCTQHSGMGGQANTNSTFGSSNFSGSIQSTVSANTTAGFSIVSYTGNGTDGATVGHGLTSPKLVLIKDRDNSTPWLMYGFPNHPTFATDGDLIKLNLSDALVSNDSTTELSIGSSTVTFVDAGSAINANSAKFIMYCFQEIKGYSKFGSYSGNGSSDGTYIHLGFKPALVIIKNSSRSSENWNLIDNKRDGFNGSNENLAPNLNGTESSGNNRWDILSNGFKCRDTNNEVNNSSDTYIYMAFAESPFVNSNGVPTNAR
jgi:hypothetical protein